MPWGVLDPSDMDPLDLISGLGGSAERDVTSLAVAEELYLTGGDTDATRSTLGLSAELGDLAGAEPAGLLRAMERLGTAGGDDHTVTATLKAPDEWVEAYGAPLPDGHAELDIGADDRPEAYRLRIAAGDASVGIDVRFHRRPGHSSASPCSTRRAGTPKTHRQSRRARQGSFRAGPRSSLDAVSLQLTAKHRVATPVNWRQGDDVIIAGSVPDDEAKEIFGSWEEPKPYIRIVAQP